MLQIRKRRPGKGRRPECRIAGDIQGHSTSGFPIQVLADRYGLRPALARIIAETMWKGVCDD